MRFGVGRQGKQYTKEGGHKPASCDFSRCDDAVLLGTRGRMRCPTANRKPRHFCVMLAGTAVQGQMSFSTHNLDSLCYFGSSRVNALQLRQLTSSPWTESALVTPGR